MKLKVKGKRIKDVKITDDKKILEIELEEGGKIVVTADGDEYSSLSAHYEDEQFHEIRKQLKMVGDLKRALEEDFKKYFL